MGKEDISVYPSRGREPLLCSFWGLSFYFLTADWSCWQLKLLRAQYGVCWTWEGEYIVSDFAIFAKGGGDVPKWRTESGANLL